MKFLVINGANLNLLGIREKDIYGNIDYNEMCKIISDKAKAMNVEVEFYQSNLEGEIINAIHNAREKFQGIVINPGAYTHYSIAIYDAIKAVDMKVIEVHISNIYAREDFRKTSVTGGACIGVISGLGIDGYILALQHLKNMSLNK